MKQYVKTFFFQRQGALILEITQHFEVVVSGATTVKGLKPPYPSHLENLTSKHERLNVI